MLWIIIGVLLLSIILSNINQLREDNKRTNKILVKIAKEMGLIPEPSVNEEIKSLILDGKKIKAIKMYRESTGLGLVDAKRDIDLLSEKLKNQEI
ncbi:ribosomal protein L7/L12 [Clostridium lacusfryxellense]|nr:ribosomal protein L7/L12 [Clostridium lacusfryxellense]